jgi:iron complex transport system substrate-binding protein
MRALKLRTVICLAAALWLAATAVTTTATSAQTPAPKRIISLIPAVTEMLFAIGAGNEVVAVSSYDRFPPEVTARPKVGALLDPDLERILSLTPDLVVVFGTQVDLIARLSRAQVPIFSFQDAGLDDITATIRALGSRIGRGDAAKALADGIERDVAAIRRQVAGRPRPKTALVFGREAGSVRGIWVSGGIGFMHDMLNAAGGADAFDDVKRKSVQATAEIMLARAPEVIIEVRGTDEPADQLARERQAWNALPALPAVRAGRVYLLGEDRLSIPGPRVVDGIRLMARTLHPEVFKDR